MCRNATPHPTVIVYIRPKSRGDFNKLDDSLTTLLQTLKSRVWLEILPGLIIESPIVAGKPWIIDRELPRLPITGSSIGAQGNIQEAGTLGGFFWLNFPNSRMKCALTCYHVTSPLIMRLSSAHANMASYLDHNIKTERSASDTQRHMMSMHLLRLLEERSRQVREFKIS